MPPKKEGIEESEVQRLYEDEGMTQKEIADYYGVSRGLIWDRSHPDKATEVAKRYAQSEKGKETRKRYKQSEKGKESTKRFFNSEKGKEIASKASKRFQQTEKGKEAMKRKNQSKAGKEKVKRYRQSEKGKEAHRRAKYKHRQLGFISKNIYFIGSEAHHIDKEHIIYLPKGIHQSIPHDVWTGKGMEEINREAMGFLELEEK